MQKSSVKRTTGIEYLEFPAPKSCDHFPLSTNGFTADILMKILSCCIPQWRVSPSLPSPPLSSPHLLSLLSPPFASPRFLSCLLASFSLPSVSLISSRLLFSILPPPHHLPSPLRLSPRLPTQHTCLPFPRFFSFLLVSPFSALPSPPRLSPRIAPVSRLASPRHIPGGITISLADCLLNSSATIKLFSTRTSR